MDDFVKIKNWRQVEAFFCLKMKTVVPVITIDFRKIMILNVKTGCIVAPLPTANTKMAA